MIVMTKAYQNSFMELNDRHFSSLITFSCNLHKFRNLYYKKGALKLVHIYIIPQIRFPSKRYQHVIIPSINNNVTKTKL